MNRRQERVRVRAWHVSVVVALSIMLVAFGNVPVFALPVQPGPAPATSPGRAVRGVVAIKPSRITRPLARNATAIDVHWPTSGSESLSLTPPSATTSVANAAQSGFGGSTLGAKASAPSGPVWAQAYDARHGGPAAGAAVRVTVLNHAKAVAAGVSGVLFAVTANHAGATRIGMNYASFAQAYGGGYGTRLRLVTYPACILTTPALASCRQATPVSTINDAVAQTVSAQVTVGAAPLVMAAQTESTQGSGGGSDGSYSATTLKPSGTWSAGGSAGDFTYNYPIEMPSSASPLVPSVALSYDSGSVDGETAATQAQSSWVGDGWSTPSSFVEQSFASCADSPEGTASPTVTGDLCYDGPILTMSLNGSSTALVWDATAKVFRSSNDTGAVITHYCTKLTDPTCVTGTSDAAGTYANDWYQVVVRDGTTYDFGLNHLPGWTGATGQTATSSVDYEPVFSAHNPATKDSHGVNYTDPCWNATWASSVCTMAYRWNLDYVKDVHGNAMAYYYQQDTNSYGQNKGTKTVSYIRDSHLSYIYYGFTDGNAYGTVPDRVKFTTGDRCFTTCDPLNATTAPNWMDTPFDLICSSSCTTKQSPSDFSTVRLKTIETQQYSLTSSQYADVDSYALTEIFPTNSDSDAQTLWLNSIQRTASDTSAGASGSITLPPVTFTGQKLQNRVDAHTDGLPAYDRWRMLNITTETGSVIGVSFGLPDPCTAPVTLTPSSNTHSCYPITWTPSGYVVPLLDWFERYAVVEVTQSDPLTHAPIMTTQYNYPGLPAWHYDDNELVKAKYRSYGQFRGYKVVQTFTGDGQNDPQTETDDLYYQGMSNDNNTTDVTVADSQGAHHEDADQLSGEVLESTTYQGSGGPVDHSTITSYWVSGATASRSRVSSGLSPLTANWVEPVETWSRQATTSTGSLVWNDLETDTSYDGMVGSPTIGLVQHVYSHAPLQVGKFDACTSTTYAKVNTAANLVGLPAGTETDSAACGGFTEGSPASLPATASINALTAPTSLTRPAQVVSDTINFYDDPAFSTTFPQTSTPTKGDVDMTRKAVSWNGTFSYQTAGQTAYDTIGRPVAQYDGIGNKMTTAYTMNSIGLTSVETVTNALVTNGVAQSTSTTYDIERGLPVITLDLNGVRTNEQYDAAGRLTADWIDSRWTNSSPPPANQTFSYQLSSSGASVTSSKLDDGSNYVTSTVILDALMRPRQTQTMTPQGGRLVSDTFFDSRGWTASTYNGWWDPATTPNTTLVSPNALNPVAHVYDSDVYTYNGLGQQITDTSEQDGGVVSVATKILNGDSSTIIPPTGGAITTTKADALGRTVEVDGYTSPPTVHTPANTFTGYYWISGGTTEPTVYGYDGHLNQSTVTQGATLNSGPTWTTTYNLLGEATERVSPDGGDTGTLSLKYDLNGNLTQSTDSRGRPISFTYDALNRRTGEFDSDNLPADQTAATQLEKWVYDNSDNAVPGMTYPIGHMTSQTAYWGGAAYVDQQKNFNIFGESLGETITVPSSTEGTILGLTGGYSFSHTYSATTGLLLSDRYPAAGGLPSEIVQHNYTPLLDQPDTLNGLASYAADTTYDATGRVTQETIGTSPNLSYITNTYDQHSGLLTDQVVQDSAKTNLDEENYKHDLAGNIVRQIDTRNNAAAPTETQCYSYDGLEDLSAAWTATDACATPPAPGSTAMVGDSLGAASAYWTTWGFDALGDRSQQVQHAFTGGPSADVSTTYCYGSATQPHTLTATATTGTPNCATAASSYIYDNAGNMIKRNTAQGNQTLTYDDAGRLVATSGASAGPTTYEYTADGSLMFQKDPNGTTMYLPGEQITLVGTVTTGVRYYPLPGGGEAIRTGTASYSYEITDRHGSASLYLDQTAQTPSWRQFTPYGAPRGAVVASPDNHGFLNKPIDSATSLTVVGARQYDPDTGRFITTDPVFDAGQPGTLNGYSYTTNNPIGQSDPSGARPCTISCGEGDPGPPPPPGPWLPGHGPGTGGTTPPCTLFCGPGTQGGGGENPCNIDGVAARTSIADCKMMNPYTSFGGMGIQGSRSCAGFYNVNGDVTEAQVENCISAWNLADAANAVNQANDQAWNAHNCDDFGKTYDCENTLGLKDPSTEVWEDGLTAWDKAHQTPAKPHSSGPAGQGAVSFFFCVIICLSINFTTDGQPTLSTGLGLGAGMQVGGATTPGANQNGVESGQLCVAGTFVGGCVGGGATNSGGAYGSGGATFGLGFKYSGSWGGSIGFSPGPDNQGYSESCAIVKCTGLGAG